MSYEKGGIIQDNLAKFQNKIMPGNDDCCYSVLNGPAFNLGYLGLAKPIESPIVYSATCRQGLVKFEFSPKVQTADCIAKRGCYYCDCEQYEKAQDHFSQALSLQPHNALILIHRALMYVRCQRYDDALADVLQAINSNPNYAEAHRWRGFVLLYLRRFEEASDACSHFLTHNPDDAFALGYRGRAYFGLGRYQEALEDLTRALELQPHEDWWLYQRALVFLRQNDPRAAHADLGEAIRLARTRQENDPLNYRNIFNLALYHLAIGESDEAIKLVGIGVSSGASKYRVREALECVQTFLHYFPDHRQTLTLKQVLGDELEKLTVRSTTTLQ